METMLNKSQRLVVNAAEKETARPILHCVHIRKGVVEAANGFVLVQKVIEYDGDDKLLLDRDDVAKLKDQKELPVTITTEGDTVKASSMLGNLPIKAQPGQFPDVDKLYPTGKPAFKIALSREQLLNVLKSLDKHEDIIRFYFYRIDSPVKFVVSSTSLGEIVAKGLIMPMWVQWLTVEALAKAAKEAAIPQDISKLPSDTEVVEEAEPAEAEG